MPIPLSARWATSPRCEVFRTVYQEEDAARYTSWNQIEEALLASMSSFDTSIAASTGSTLADDEKSELGADLQNGKGDFFNDLLVLLLERCRAFTCSRPGAWYPVSSSLDRTWTAYTGDGANPLNARGEGDGDAEAHRQARGSKVKSQHHCANYRGPLVSEYPSSYSSRPTLRRAAGGSTLRCKSSVGLTLSAHSEIAPARCARGCRNSSSL